MAMNKPQLSVIWNQFGPASSLAKRFYMTGRTGYLPFLVWGIDCEKYENTQEVQLDERNLLFGILYAWEERNRWHENNEENLRLLLDILGNRFHCENPEVMILDAAAFIRNQLGSSEAKRILKNGMLLIPTSHKIKCDYIADAWAVMQEEESFPEDLAKEIILLSKEVDPEQLDPGPRSSFSSIIEKMNLQAK